MVLWRAARPTAANTIWKSTGLQSEYYVSLCAHLSFASGSPQTYMGKITWSQRNTAYTTSHFKVTVSSLGIFIWNISMVCYLPVNSSSGSVYPSSPARGRNTLWARTKFLENTPFIVQV